MNGFNYFAAIAVACLMALFATTSTVSAQGDVAILNYALVLEHLEYAFYRDMLKKYGPKHVGRGRFHQLIQIRNHERDHVDVLNTTIASLGGKAVKECEYGFNVRSAGQFLAVARVLENVGVSAYTGAAYEIKNTGLLTAAATIATIEARHASYLNQINGMIGFPAAFDSPLDKKAVVGLAGGFIKSCPDAIPITPYAAFTITPAKAKVSMNIRLTHELPDVNGLHCVFYSNSASVASPVEVLEGEPVKHRCKVPEGANKGDNFVFLMTSQAYSLTDGSKVKAGPALFTVG